jgi:uncharacterized protein YgiM (DUF1202 family)
MQSHRYVFSALFALALSGHAIADSFRPFDEATRDPTFAGFRAKFLKVVRVRDTSSLESHLHPNVRMNLGNGGGPSEALRIMRQEPWRWSVLERILQRGGGFKIVNEAAGPARMFFAPYTFFAKLGDGSEVFNVAVVTSDNVNVRLGPSKDTKVIAQLSHWVVFALSPSGDGRKWVKVRTREGKTGFINAKYVAWTTDFRAGFLEHQGRWKLRVFLAGD